MTTGSSETAARRRRGARLPLAALGDLEKVADGGQGVIFRPSRYPGLLYKQYKSPSKVNAKSLDYLRRQRLKMTEADRSILDVSAAWPAILIEDVGRTVGFLMAPAARRFFHDFGRAGLKPLDLQYLIFPTKRTWKDLELPDIAGRIAICAGIAYLVDLMHRQNLVVGDISMSNILWTTTPSAAVYLIDCDGVRHVGAPPVLEQTNTPEWIDPADTSHATFNTDRYKLALAMIRIMSIDAYAVPGQASFAIPDLGVSLAAPIVSLVRQIQPRGGPRPSATEWLSALTQLAGTL